MGSGIDVCLDRRITIDAAGGLLKAKVNILLIEISTHDILLKSCGVVCVLTIFLIRHDVHLYMIKLENN